MLWLTTLCEDQSKLALETSANSKTFYGFALAGNQIPIKLTNLNVLFTFPYNINQMISIEMQATQEMTTLFSCYFYVLHSLFLTLLGFLISSI